MFGISAFGTIGFSSNLRGYRVIVDAEGLAAFSLDLVGDAGAVASTAGQADLALAPTGQLAAVKSAEGLATFGTTFAGVGTTVWLSQGEMQLVAELAGNGAAVVSAVGAVALELKVEAQKLRAYDQLFPATVVNGNTVQVGRRLYTWSGTTARWAFSGIAPE